jgi:hypothetical protein
MEFTVGLKNRYPHSTGNVQLALADCPKQPFIEASYTSPKLGQTFTEQNAKENCGRDGRISSKTTHQTYWRNTMATVSITSHEGALNSASAVLEVKSHKSGI